VDQVHAPYTGEPAADVVQATDSDLDEAIESAQVAFAAMRAMPRHARHDLLHRVTEALTRQRTELGIELAISCGKPITQALGEVDRAIMTFSLAADEARRFGGEVVPLDVDTRGVGMNGLVNRFPIGPISAISPFNFPLNLLAHKVAPAIAVGSALVVKPPPQCPQLAFRLGEILADCGMPAGAYNVLHLPIPIAEGWRPIRASSCSPSREARLWAGTSNRSPGRRKSSTTGRPDAPAVAVHEDAGDFDWVANRLAFGGFAYAGQVCIKVQRIYVERAAYAPFLDKLLARVKDVPTGDPGDEKTVCGPVIDDRSAERITAWVDEAVARGARVLAGHTRKGRMLAPTVLVDVPPDAKAAQEEIFGPVVAVWPVADWEEVLAAINSPTSACRQESLPTM
jgi:glyceraldehyde-3-phosphate dehydrogenase (NADP+)